MKLRVAGASLGLLFFFVSTAGAQDAPKIDDAWQKKVVEAIGERLGRGYVFPEKATEMAEVIEAQYANGNYRGLDDGNAFAERLTRDLQAVTHDKHLRVRFSPEPRSVAADQPPTPEEQEAQLARARWQNYGFEKVERLPGNVGYLDLRGFLPTQFASETAIAAMTFLGNSDAIIIDLRFNGGGSPAMVALITSYFFDAEPVHLNSLYYRPTDSTQQWWTLPYVPGKRYPDTPLYVLTSNRTFSAAEEFSYNLRSRERATLVGETTGGGAHPGGTEWIDEHFQIWVPRGRAINPITGTNWEGTGVEPHIAVPAEQALQKAHVDALQKLAAKQTDPRLKTRLEEILQEVQGSSGGPR
ncbi:MAG: S41 family peptidase [Planctomycetota bacterium]